MYCAGVTQVDGPQFLRVIGDRHRWAILSALASSDRRVGELTELVGERQNLVSYHLRELRDAGLVSSRRSSFDGRDAYYRLNLDRCRDLFRASAAALHPALRLVPNASTPPRRPGRAPRVLFLCTGNSARSQMAAALLEHRSGRAVQARSAGSHPKALHPNAVRAMGERGIDISDNTTRHLHRYAGSHFDQVITLCDKVREVCPEFPGGPATAHWSLPDPAAEGSTDDERYAAFERAADELEDRVDQLIARLFASQGGPSHAR
jgi:protein-tyrosine-phosphatase/DNA-binding transcriptional ArsR family regulator